MPLISTGNEDIYFTASPSPYLTEVQLKGILWDHIYARHGDGIDLSALGPQDRETMRQLYHTSKGYTFGVGERHSLGYWIPNPTLQLQAPAGSDI